MGAPVVDVADALVTALNAATMTQTFTAVRKHTHTADRNNLTLQVLLVPKSDEQTQFARGLYQRDIAVDIAVIGPCETEAERKALSDLCEEIKDEIRGDAMGGASFVGLKHNPLYSIDDAGDTDLFTAVITANYVTVE